MMPLENGHPKWNSIYKIGAVAALCAVLVGLLEMGITFLPGGNINPQTVLDWFELFQANPFMGLRDLGLLNILLTALGILIFFALYAVLRQGRDQPYATLALIITFIGTGIFYATNRAFPMLSLSQQYAAATTDLQRTILQSAGQSLLSVGQSHTAGTFLGFFINEIAWIVITIVMLRGKLFNKITAITGILGWSILSIHEFLTSFGSGVNEITMMVAIPGGLFLMAWYILIAARLFQFSRNPVERSEA